MKKQPLQKNKNTATSSRIQEYYDEQLNEYFEKKHFRVTSNGKIKIGNVSVNKKDLLYDLTHQAVKPSSFNLTAEQQRNVLMELKKTGMPASSIRNTHLRKIYINGKHSGGETSFLNSESGSDTDDILAGQYSLSSPKKSFLKYDRAIGRGREK